MMFKPSVRPSIVGPFLPQHAPIHAVVWGVGQRGLWAGDVWVKPLAGAVGGEWIKKNIIVVAPHQRDRTVISN